MVLSRKRCHSAVVTTNYTNRKRINQIQAIYDVSNSGNSSDLESLSRSFVLYVLQMLFFVSYAVFDKISTDVAV